MNEGLKKFEELLKTNAAFQEKLKAAMESYNGEQTEEAVFEGVLAPLAGEYGISASFEEFKEYITALSNEDRELTEDEVDLVAGGGKGFGATACLGIGAGLGGSTTDADSICIGIGLSNGVDACAGKGVGSNVLNND